MRGRNSLASAFLCAHLYSVVVLRTIRGFVIMLIKVPCDA